MKKKVLITVCVMVIATVTCFAGNISDKKEKNVVAPSRMEQLGKELKLSQEQMMQLRKVNSDFATQRKQHVAKNRKEKSKEMQARTNRMRRNAKTMCVNQVKMQQDYLSSVRKIMDKEQYVAFLENYWVKQHVARKGVSMAQRTQHSHRKASMNVCQNCPGKGPKKGGFPKNVRTVCPMDSAGKATVTK